MRTRRAVLFGIIGTGLVTVAALGTVFSSRIFHAYGRSSGGLANKRVVAALWKDGKYKEAYDACSEVLSRRPLDTFFLLYGGFSAFYAGIARIDDEEKKLLLESCVAWLRKSRFHPDKSMSAEISYILGKSYYHLGYYHLDQSIRELEEARRKGFKSSDLDEYLGMAYLNLGKVDPAIACFNRSLSKGKSDQLLIAVASAYEKSGDMDRALESLREAVETTKDALTEERARLTIAGILFGMKRIDESGQEYSAILEKNSDSADAHYGQGLVHEARGDVVQARAEWRKAIRIEPMHQAARQKLSQK